MKKLILSILVCMTLVVGLAVQSYALPLSNAKVNFEVGATGVTSAMSGALDIKYTYALYYENAGVGTIHWLGVAGAGITHTLTSDNPNKNVIVQDFWQINGRDVYLAVTFNLAANNDYLTANVAFSGGAPMFAGDPGNTLTNIKGYFSLETPSNSDWSAEMAVAQNSRWDMVNVGAIGAEAMVLSTVVGIYHVGIANTVAPDDYQIGGDDLLARINAGAPLRSWNDPANAVTNPATMGAILDPRTGAAPGSYPPSFTSSGSLEVNVIPEPCTMGLIATGLIGLIGMRRRQRKA